jgi:hypothetical protein
VKPHYYEVNVALHPGVHGGSAFGPFDTTTSKIGVNVLFRETNYYAYLVPGMDERRFGEEFPALLLMSADAPKFSSLDHLVLYSGNDLLGSATVCRFVEGDWKERFVDRRLP